MTELINLFRQRNETSRKQKKNQRAAVKYVKTVEKCFRQKSHKSSSSNKAERE